MNKFNPLAYVPFVVRLTAYILYGLLGFVLIYLQEKGIVIGPPELKLYVGVGTFLGLTAASNIQLDSKKPSDSRDLGKKESEDFLF